MGYTFLEMAREIGHSAAMAKLHWGMMLLRREKKNPRYMHRYAEYDGPPRSLRFENPRLPPGT